MLRTLKGRRGQSYGIGALLCSVALIVPLVFGVAPVPRELPFSENVAWLANEAQGDVVRLNIDTGRIDARLALDSVAESLAVGQGYGSVVVNASDRLTAIDLASLAWGTSVSAQGDLFVGDDVAYLVTRDGMVDALDPQTLESKGEVDLGASVARPVVEGERLIVPVQDGTVAVLQKSEIVDRLEVGSDSDRLEVTMVDDDAVALNLTDGSLLRFDPTRNKVDPRDEVTFDPPSGPMLVPDASPGDQVWMAAPAEGELVGVDVDDGGAASVQVTEPGHDLVGPVVVGERVYLVDVTQSVVIGVDMDGPEVVDLQPIDIEDPSAVEMLVVGESVVINDKSGPSAIVIDDRGDFKQVDKYSEDGVATSLNDVELVSDTGGNNDATDPSEPGDAPPQQGNPPPDQGNPPPNQNSSPPPRDQGQPSEPGPSPQPPPPPPSTTTSTTDPRVDPPRAVGGLSATSDDGRSTLSWSAPGGDVDDYVIEVSPAINGRTSYTSTGTSYTFTSLANGTQYTFTVSARNEGGTGPGSSATATPGGHPTVSGVSPNRTGDREFSVSFSYNNNGRAVDTCQVTVNGTTHNANCDGGTGSVSGISVGNYATSYTFTALVGTSLGSQDADGSGTSANKPLTVDADPARFAVWDGVCTWNPDEGGQPNTRPYYNAAVHNCPNEGGGPAGYLGNQTGVRATCRTSGDSVTDDQSNESSTWVRIDGYGYMNTLWFTNWNNSPEANLPECGS